MVPITTLRYAYSGGTNTGFEIGKGSDQVTGYKDRPNCLILDPNMVGGKENLWFLDALKCWFSQFILPEKAWKGIKTAFFKI